MANYDLSPRILLANCISFGKIVTLFAWIAHKLVSSKIPTKLKPPNGPKDDFADAILRSGNLLSEYRTIFRKYESAVAAQGVASAQLKHTLASKQHIESEILHIKSRLQQIQFDWGKERGSFNL